MIRVMSRNQSSYLDSCLVSTAHVRLAAIFICLLVRGRFRASASSLACFVASRPYLPGAPVNNYTTILFCEVKSYISLKPSGVTLFRWQPLDLAVYWTIDVGRLRRYFLLPAEAEQLRMRDQYPTELSPLDKSSATVFKHYMPL